jgi:hypothetical protein
MKKRTSVSCPSAKIPGPPRSQSRTLGHVPLRAADAKRSVKNILTWNTYLPSDCVRSMVRMGWDYTT